MGRVAAIPLPALPEIEPGADLAELIAGAWRDLASAEPELAPQPVDVLVVTQKIVSKAEGQLVDLRTIEPRPEAVDVCQGMGSRRTPGRAGAA